MCTFIVGWGKEKSGKLRHVDSRKKKSYGVSVAMYLRVFLYDSTDSMLF